MKYNLKVKTLATLLALSISTVASAQSSTMPTVYFSGDEIPQEVKDRIENDLGITDIAYDAIRYMIVDPVTNNHYISYWKVNNLTAINSSGYSARPFNSIINGDNSYGEMRSVVYGHSSRAGYEATVIGTQAYGGSSSVVIGHGAVNATDSGVSIGSNSYTHTGGVAVGYDSEASAYGCVALGSNSSCNERNTVSVGGEITMLHTDINGNESLITSNTYRRIVNVANGINGNDAATINQLKDITEYFGGGATITNGTIFAPNYTFMSGMRFRNVGSALYDLDRRVHNLENNPSTGGEPIPGPQGPQGEKGDKGDAGRDGIDGNGKEVIAGDNIKVEEVDGKTQVSLAEEVKIAKTIINQNGINAGGNRVEGVGNGRVEQNSQDAINGHQMWEMQQEFNDRWDLMDNKINQMGKQWNDKFNAQGAKSAAMAMMASASQGLAVGQTEMTAGVGFQSNKSALAVGYRVRFSERVTFSAGFAVGNGSPAMGGIGVSIRSK